MAAGRGIADVADTHGADKPFQVRRQEYIPHQAVRLVEEHFTLIAACHAGGILPPVLENAQRLI
jgi:hypothetical protein